jgi:ATP-dependent helicase/nuclease subunit A
MLTPSQQHALILDTHLCVTANAGSGKTLVLVERYLDIVCRGDAGVGEVVAITFTEKAASELKRKIADGVTRRLMEQPHMRATLERVREQLPSALIHTIHGFCSRILREYPVEGGVDASFTVVESIDQEALLQESFTEVYRAILRDNAHPELKDPVLALTRRIGKGAVTHIAETLGRKRELTERLTGAGGIYDRGDAEVLASWHTELGSRLAAAMDDPVLITALSELTGMAQGKPADTVRVALEQFLTPGDLHARALLLSSMLSTILTGNGSIAKRFLGKSVEAPDPEPLAERARRLRPLIEAVTGPDSATTHAALLQATRTLLAVHRLAVERYAEKKAGAGQLDFDDLQLFTRDLLKKESVRTRLASRYRFIMVDEYQDTNRLQYDILLPLINGFTSGNLFIVGDPKQSIYGFRNADVAVFERTSRDIRARSGPAGSIVLGESFRLLPEVAAFTNTVFTPLMGGSGHETAGYDVPYDEMIVGRKSAAGGRVELILREGETATMTEGEAIARRVRRLYGEQFQVFGREEEPHALRFRDVAVLLRSRKSLGDFEQAFVRFGVPYVVSGGTGYFQTQLIFDFYSYIRCVLNKHDDVALAGILRSPFFSVSDAELYQAAGEYRPGSLWDHLIEHRNRLESEALSRAIRMLEEDLALGPRMTVPELLDRIVDRTGINAILEAVPRGDQGIANLRKLEDIAGSFDRKGFTTLYDFAARLKRLMEEEEKEGQAVIDVQRDAVRIMTVHGAKGLEFPVVIIPSLERTFLPERQPFLDEALGVGFNHSREDDSTPAPLMEVLRHEARAKSIAEEKRIFYVACTRARDCLILSAKTGNRTATTWFRWVERALPSLHAAGDAPVLEVASRLRKLTGSDGRQTVQTHEHLLTVHLVREKDLAELPGIAPPLRRVPEPERIAIDPVLRPPRGEIFSASRIRTYLECPAKYYLRYVLGMPDREYAASQAKGADEDRDDSIDPGARGTIIHRVLQRMDTMSPGEVQQAVTDLANAEGGAGEKSREEITATLTAILRSPFWKKISGGTQASTEIALTGTLDGDYLTGTIDRLFLDDDGVWHIVDYKTDRVETSDLDNRVKVHLTQLKLYALLVARHHKSSLVRCTLFFSGLVDLPRTVTFSLEDLLQFENDLRKTINRINSLDFKPLQFPCPVCEFPPEGCQSLFPG